MPHIPPEKLVTLSRQLFEAVGCSAEDANVVAWHLVDSSLFGHDSHGIIRIYEYVYQIKDGIFDPEGKPFAVRETPCTAVLDGDGVMGQVAAQWATGIAIDKAREHGISTVTLRNTCHIGRIGAYPLAHILWRWPRRVSLASSIVTQAS